jgi:hypothetical protein
VIPRHAAPDSVALARSNAAVGRYPTVHQQTVDSRAVAQIPTVPAFLPPNWFGSRVPAPRKLEMDGLSRHSDDCNYGCIDH